MYMVRCLNIKTILKNKMKHIKVVRSLSLLKEGGRAMGGRGDYLKGKGENMTEYIELTCENVMKPIILYR